MVRADERVEWPCLRLGAARSGPAGGVRSLLPVFDVGASDRGFRAALWSTVWECGWG